MTRHRLRWLLPLAAAPLLAAPVWAQQAPTPEELDQRQVQSAAETSTRAAYELVENFGRKVLVPAPTPAQLRDRALRRLSDPRGPRPQRPARAPRFNPENDLEELRGCRSLILERLNRLDPDRFPLPKPTPRPRRGEVELKIIDVQDLVFAPEDHFAPPVGLGNMYSGRGGGGAGGVLCFDDEESEMTRGVGISPSKLIELIEAELGDEDDRGSIEFTAGRLIIRKTAAAIETIQRLLKRVSKNRGGLVDLEVRLYRMPPTLFATLRSSASALTLKGEAALAKATADGRATLLSTHRVIAHDGQQVHVRRGSSRSFIADIMVNQTGVVPVVYPEVNVLNEGLVVELRPLVDRERRAVLIDAALSLTGLTDEPESRMVEGIELELPKLGIIRTGSSTCVPLGQGALLGGVFHIDGEAGKPQTCVVYVRPHLVQGR
jgi:hypothetical protein